MFFCIYILDFLISCVSWPHHLNYIRSWIFYSKVSNSFFHLFTALAQLFPAELIKILNKWDKSHTGQPLVRLIDTIIQGQ